MLQGKLHLQLLGLLPWWQTEHAFSTAHLSELPHCLVRIYIPSFEQCKQIRATLARRSSSLCGTGVALARQETGLLPDRKTCEKNIKEKEEGKTSRSERMVNFGPTSQRFLNQKVFVHFLSSAPLLSMLRHRRATSWTLPCVCTLTSSACAGWHDVFGCQKQTWKRHSRLTT